MTQTNSEDSKTKIVSWPRLLAGLLLSIFNVVAFVSAMVLVLSPDRTVFWVGVVLAVYVVIHIIYRSRRHKPRPMDSALRSEGEEQNPNQPE